MLEFEIDKKQISVEYENNLPPGATFLVDKMRTQQVLLNMLSYTVQNAPQEARVKFFLTPRQKVQTGKEGQKFRVFIAVGVVDEFHRRQQSGPHTRDKDMCPESMLYSRQLAKNLGANLDARNMGRNLFFKLSLNIELVLAKSEPQPPPFALQFRPLSDILLPPPPRAAVQSRPMMIALVEDDAPTL
jgi:hypothetical protein